MRILEPVVYALPTLYRVDLLSPLPISPPSPKRRYFFFSNLLLHPEQGGQLGKRLGRECRNMTSFPQNELLPETEYA